MNMFWHPAIRTIRDSSFNYSENMYPADYGHYFHHLPVMFQDGSLMQVRCAGYRSGVGSRNQAKNAFLRAARDYTKKNMETVRHHVRGDWHLWFAHKWLTEGQSVGRVVGCFAGQALP